MKLPKYYEKEEVVRYKKLNGGIGHTAFVLIGLSIMTAFVPVAFVVGSSFKVLRKISERLK